MPRQPTRELGVARRPTEYKESMQHETVDCALLTFLFPDARDDSFAKQLIKSLSFCAGNSRRQLMASGQFAAKCRRPAGRTYAAIKRKCKLYAREREREREQAALCATPTTSTLLHAPHKGAPLIAPPQAAAGSGRLIGFRERQEFGDLLFELVCPFRLAKSSLVVQSEGLRCVLRAAKHKSEFGEQLFCNRTFEAVLGRMKRGKWVSVSC